MTLLERLRSSPPNVLLQREAADEIERLQRQLRQAERDAREDARGAATEAHWQHAQGEEYGSY